MDLAAPPAGSNPTPLPEPTESGPPPDDGSDRIVAGVAALIGDRLGIDPLWIRIGFVLLALAGGIGVLVYAGLWLVLIAGRASGREWPRYLGAILLLAILPLVLNGGSFDLMTGPVAVILLLVGLTLALWQPRLAATTHGPVAPPSFALPAAAAPTPPTPRPPRPRSVLGRATLGMAIVVAALGALIDQANGGRLHPEQWLGAAAVVCGAGLLVGTVRGYARWLVVPAAAFAGAGFLAAPVARLGIDMDDLAGDQHVWIGAGTPGGLHEEHVGFGAVNIDVTAVPEAPVTIDARVAIGEVRVDAAAGVTVELRSRIDEGTMYVNGTTAADDVVRIGPDGDPDVIVNARVGRGDVDVWPYARIREELAPVPPIVTPGRPPVDVGPLTPVADFVAATDDGWFVLADGAAVIDADDQLVVGQAMVNESGVSVVPTPVGDFQLLPRSLLITPVGEILDLEAIRTELAPTPPSTTIPG